MASAPEDFSFSGFWQTVEDERDRWQTDKGILERLGMLAHDVEFGTFNNSLKVAATSLGMTDLKFSGPGKNDPKICDYCSIYVGLVYHRGQFMPELPAHPRCRHYWEIIRAGAPTDIFAEMLKEEQRAKEGPGTPAPDIFKMLGQFGA